VEDADPADTEQSDVHLASLFAVPFAPPGWNVPRCLVWERSQVAL